MDYVCVFYGLRCLCFWLCVLVCVVLICGVCVLPCVVVVVVCVCVVHCCRCCLCGVVFVRGRCAIVVLLSVC